MMALPVTNLLPTLSHVCTLFTAIYTWLGNVIIFGGSSTVSVLRGWGVIIFGGSNAVSVLRRWGAGPG